MTSAALETLRAQLRGIDQDLLRALDARARFPRDPWPTAPAAGSRGSGPLPLAEILIAISPAGTAERPDEVEPANRGLVAALLARQELAGRIAEAKFDLAGAAARAALETGDRERMATLLADLSAELHLIDFIRAQAVELAPHLPDGLAPLLWREYLIPWTRQSEIARLLEP